MRIVVVGGGIVGVAAAHLLVRDRRELDVLLLEKEATLASHQTGHNSGVVHAGIYYKPGSLKSRLCRRGAELLSVACHELGVPITECGKVVVATNTEELDGLRRLAERASANAVPGLRWLDEGDLRATEPHAAGLAALHSPSTAIVDFGAVTRALAAQITERGGRVHTATTVSRVSSTPNGVSVELADGERLTADRALVCAGLHADRLARASGEPAEPRVIPFRGEYWKLAPERRDLVRGLIYPVPDQALPFLGVHLTRTIDGDVLIGPNALLAPTREGYSRSTVNARDALDTLTWPGTWRMMRRHWRAGVSEMHRSASRRAFVGGARRFVPELQAEDVRRALAGLRAQAVSRDGTLIDDFCVTRSRNVLWVRNAPSPAATAALAIAEELSSRLVW